MARTGNARVALTTCAKNEGPWLLEWVAHHKAVGFDEIAIATNDSDDKTDEIASRLAALGQVHHIDNPPPYWQHSDKIRIQATGYDRLQKLPAVAACEWYMALDMDEFLIVHVGEGHIRDLINHYRFPRPNSILVRWRLFGDSGHEFYIAPPITDKLKRCAPLDSRLNINFRSVTRDHPRFVVEGHEDFRARRLDQGGSPITYWIWQYLGWTWVAFDRHRFPAPRALKKLTLRRIANRLKIGQDLETAQVNHYAVRTPGLVMLKALRGRGTGRKSEKRFTPQYYARFNQNDAHDPSIAKYADTRNRLLQQFLSDTCLKKHHENAIELTRSKLAECQEDLPVFIARSKCVQSRLV